MAYENYTNKISQSELIKEQNGISSEGNTS